ncbi:hypothetical protein QKT26_gp11 [Carcinus maenas nudivirus]|uniref:Uncharacterized protein n=1 Tax=Carcinus maenas nudivirus TaxID=2880837 RepID=A0AAE8Y0U1_9VIRU|nr:hypothetical protein QKT26_gp11 [Carcinus maenas nudivirus]UBZ25601.1 hypothetical protein CmNV_011 [Carcinus maenas nudivirus]
MSGAKRFMDDDTIEEPQNKKTPKLDDDEDDCQINIDEIYNNHRNKNSKTADDDIVEEEIDDGITFMTSNDFKKGRLNIISSVEPIEINATMEMFNQTLDMIMPKNKKLSEIIKNKDKTNQYQILHACLGKHFTTYLENNPETMKLIMLVLNGLLIFHDDLDVFQSRISGMINIQESLNVKKLGNNLTNYLSKFLGEIEEDDEPNEELVHFKDMPEMYNAVMSVFSMCNKIVKFSTAKNMAFKQMTYNVIESRDSAQMSITKQAQKITLQTPTLLKVSTKNLSDGNIILTVDATEGELISETIKNALFFKKPNKPDKLDANIYQNITIGELKEIVTLKVFDTTNKAIHKNFNKKSVPNDTYIVVDGFNLIFNETPTKVGISIKCWPQKIPQKDMFDNNMYVHMLDFTNSATYINHI